MAKEPAGDGSGNSRAQVRSAGAIDSHVGSRVRVRRLLLGLSQEQLGERLGVTFQQIQKYERGVNRIGASRLFELAAVLGVPVQFFYDEAPPSASTDSPLTNRDDRDYSHIFEILEARDGRELNKAFARIGDSKIRAAIIDLVRSLAGD